MLTYKRSGIEFMKRVQLIFNSITKIINVCWPTHYNKYIIGPL